MVKNLPAMQETWLLSWVGMIPWRWKWQRTSVFLPGEFHGQSSLVDYILFLNIVVFWKFYKDFNLLQFFFILNKYNFIRNFIHFMPTFSICNLNYYS